MHTFFACGYLSGDQDNWLITQYINITDDGVRELTVNVTFSSTAEGPTEQSFALWSYGTDNIDEAGHSDKDMYSDTGIRLLYIAEGVVLDFDSERFSINTNGLYLAVVDRGSCTSITRISVFYYICPEQTVNLIHYPETVAPPFSNPQDREATGVCIDNASQASADLTLECKIRGEWEENVDAMCSCNPGYEKNDSSCSGECHKHSQ